jgi:hypothetical protein
LRIEVRSPLVSLGHLEKEKKIISFSACTHTPWRPSKIPPLSPHTLSITIRLPMSSTLLAISWAMDGVRGRLFNPSHRRLPCASICYSGWALRQACEELGLTQRQGSVLKHHPPPLSQPAHSTRLLQRQTRITDRSARQSTMRWIEQSSSNSIHSPRYGQLSGAHGEPYCNRECVRRVRGDFAWSPQCAYAHRKRDIFCFFFQMTGRYQWASHFVSRRLLRLLNMDDKLP